MALQVIAQHPVLFHQRRPLPLPHGPVEAGAMDQRDNRSAIAMPFVRCAVRCGLSHSGYAMPEIGL